MAKRKLKNKNFEECIDLTIITPSYNEEMNINYCINKVSEIMEKFLPSVNYEHIISDNASSDNTAKIVRQACIKNKRLKLVVSSKNVGPFMNMYRALEKASGQAIVPMLPADLQDPPELIPQMYELWISKGKTVFGQRIEREEIWSMRVVRNLYYRLVRFMSGQNLPLGVGEFMVVDRRIINSILETRDYYPYLRGLVALSISDYIIVPYKWEKRQAGKSSNNLFRLIDQGINGLISTSRFPARMSLLIGFGVSTLSVIYAIVSIIILTLSDRQISAGIPTLIVTTTFFGGLILFFLGIIGEYVLAIHSQVRKIPDAFDVELVNFS